MTKQYLAIGKPMYSDLPCGAIEKTFKADSMEDARQWVINHCDASYEWTLAETDNIMRVLI